MITIPAGKKVIINKDGSDICAGYQPLVLDDAVSVQMTSEFESIVDNGAISWLTTLSGISQSLFKKGSLTGAFKELSYKQWTGTSPLTFNFNVTLNSLKTAGGYTDINRQAVMIMKIALPREGKLDSGEYGLVAPGPSVLQAFNQKNSDLGARYSIRIGSIYCPSIVIQSVNPTYSQEYIKLPNGGLQPLFITLEIGVSSIFTATQQMLNGFGQGGNSEAWYNDVYLQGKA